MLPVNNEATPAERPERRAFERIRVSIFGRFMLPNKQEFPCQIINMSPNGAAMISAHREEVGQPVIVYLDHVGRIEGTIARHFTGGFAFSYDATERKREKILAKLKWIEGHAKYGLPEHRIHERKEPEQKLTELKMPDGRAYPCKIIDISLSGAAIEMKVKPEMGAKVELGGLKGIIVRHFDEGIALQFLQVQQDDKLDKFLA